MTLDGWAVVEVHCSCGEDTVIPFRPWLVPGASVLRRLALCGAFCCTGSVLRLGA